MGVYQKKKLFCVGKLGTDKCFKKHLIHAFILWLITTKGKSTGTSVLLGTIFKCYRYFELQIMQHFGIISNFLNCLIALIACIASESWQDWRNEVRR